VVTFVLVQFTVVLAPARVTVVQFAVAFLDTVILSCVGADVGADFGAAVGAHVGVAVSVAVPFFGSCSSTGKHWL
jgi:hypothetical protein